MSLKDYFNDGRTAQKKHQQTQQMRKHYPPIRLKPKKLAFYDPRLIIRGMGIVWEMVVPLLWGVVERLGVKKQKPTAMSVQTRDTALSKMMVVIRRDVESVLVWLRLRKPKGEFERYREFLDVAEGKK